VRRDDRGGWASMTLAGIRRVRIECAQRSIDVMHDHVARPREQRPDVLAVVAVVRRRVVRAQRRFVAPLGEQHELARLLCAQHAEADAPRLAARPVGKHAEQLSQLRLQPGEAVQLGDEQSIGVAHAAHSDAPARTASGSLEVALACSALGYGTQRASSGSSAAAARSRAIVAPRMSRFVRA